MDSVPEKITFAKNLNNINIFEAKSQESDLQLY